MENIRVLLVDDHALVRAGFRRILDETDGFEVVGESGDAATAIELAHRLDPSIVLMDISLPDRSGIDAIRSIREAAPSCRVVMLSQYDRIHYVEDSLRAGASGYLLKTASAGDLTAGLRAASEGSCSLSPEMASRIVQDVIPGDGSSPTHARLTARETQVLRFVAEGMSSKQIALELEISSRTAETHRANVMHKLGLNGTADLVRFAIREGFVAP